MAGDAEVIKEFLVDLGFRLDQNAMRKWDSWLGKAGRDVVLFGAGVTTAAAAITTFVAKMSDGMEELFYQSQRTGASVKSLQAIGYAAGQIGLTSSAARFAVEGMVSAMRLQPGLREMLLGLGVSGDTPTKFFENFIKRMKEISSSGPIGPAIAAQYASMIGLSPEELLMFENNLDKFLESEEHARRMLSQWGIDSQKLAESSRDFNNSLREIGFASETLGLLMTQHLIGPAQGFLNLLNEIIRTVNLPLPQALSHLAEMIYNLSDPQRLIHMIRGEATPGSNISGAKGFGGETEVGTRGIVLGSGSSGHWWNQDPLAQKIYEMLNPSSTHSRVEMPMPPPLAAPGSTGGLGGDSRQHAVDFFKRMGWSDSQARGMVQRLVRESELNPSAIGDAGAAYGIAQWHPDRQKLFKKWAGHDIRGSSYDEQLAFVNYELSHSERGAGNQLRQAMNQSSAYDAFTRLYERPRSITINAPVTVTLLPGAGDHDTANLVAGGINQSFGDLLRDLAPKFQ